MFVFTLFVNLWLPAGLISSGWNASFSSLWLEHIKAPLPCSPTSVDAVQTPSVQSSRWRVFPSSSVRLGSLQCGKVCQFLGNRVSLFLLIMIKTSGMLLINNFMSLLSILGRSKQPGIPKLPFCHSLQFLWAQLFVFYRKLSRTSTSLSCSCLWWQDCDSEGTENEQEAQKATRMLALLCAPDTTGNW